MELMTRDAFQEEGEAAGKWNRARLTSAQLTTYFYGYSEMMKLREAAQGAPGFSEHTYHESAPVPRLAWHALPAWADGSVAGLKPRAVRRRGPRAVGESTATSRGRCAGVARSSVSGCALSARCCCPPSSPPPRPARPTRTRLPSRTRTPPSREPSPVSTRRSSKSTSSRRTPRAGGSGSPGPPDSGAIISAEGHVITNHHVVGRATSIP